jgi:hypothetical protein
MGARASELVRQEFGLDLTVSRYVAAYNELLDDPVRTKIRATKARPHLRSPLQKGFS